MPRKPSKKRVSKNLTMGADLERQPMGAKWRRQMAQLIALSRLTGYPMSVFIEQMMEQFLEVNASNYLKHCSVSLEAWEELAARISESDIEVWTPLWAVLQDGYDQAIGGESAPECGDPGSQYAVLEHIAEDAGVNRIYTIQAAVNRFCNEHADGFIADPHNLKYRVPTKEEEEVLLEVNHEHDWEFGPRRWIPEDDPLFRRKLQQRVDDSIRGLDAGIQ